MHSFFNILRQPRHILLSSLLVFFFSQPAFSDEALLRVFGGSLKMSDGAATTISMDEETVRITLGKESYDVDATFEFFNHGKTATVTVGFPKSGHGYPPVFSGVGNLTGFRTWANGVEVIAKEVPGEITIGGLPATREQLDKALKEKQGLGWLEETRWMVKKVTFPGNARTTTRVRYTAPYDEHFTDGVYLYGTGRSWRETIGVARFIFSASPEILLHGASFTRNGAYQNIRNYEFTRRGEFEFEYTLRNFEPDDDENLKFSPAIDWTASEDTTLSEKPIERRRLELLSLRHLKLLRGSIYAMHGKIFKDPDLDKYFRQFEWYQPRTDYRDSELNDTERNNITEILVYENELRKQLKIAK